MFFGCSPSSSSYFGLSGSHSGVVTAQAGTTSIAGDPRGCAAQRDVRERGTPLAFGFEEAAGVLSCIRTKRATTLGVPTNCHICGTTSA